MSLRWKGGFVQLYFDPLTQGPITPALYSWGRDVYGALGQNIGNSAFYRSSPVQVGSEVNWAKVFGNTDIYAQGAIKSDGTLWTWGYNNQGQLGDGTRVYKSSPVQVGALTTWATAAFSVFSTAAIKTDGTLWTWGRNNQGQLASGTVIDRSSPVQVGSLTDWSKVSGGGAFFCAVKTNGTLWAWGSNSDGQLGDGIGYGGNRSSPVQIGALTNWLDVSCGTYHSIAVKTNGQLWAWGFNSDGRMGTGNVISRSSPVQIGSLTTWSKVGTQDSAGMAIKIDGTLWSWGYNLIYGGLGVGNTINRSSPVQVGIDTDWLKIAGNGRGALGIKTNGQLWGFGRGDNGMLDNSQAVNYSSPVQIGSLSSWLDIACSGSTAFGLIDK